MFLDQLNKVNKKGEIVKKFFELNGASYKLQDRYCNKPKCKCHEGNPHGPYWYSYSEQGTKYVGKELPSAVLQQLENIKNLAPTADIALDDVNHRIAETEQLLFALKRSRRTIKTALGGGRLYNDEVDYLISLGLGGMTNKELL